MPDDNVIDFNSLKKEKKSSAPTEQEAAEMEELVSRLAALPAHMQEMIGSRVSYLMMYTVIAARVTEELKKDGYNPDDFEPEEDSTEAFLRHGPSCSEEEDEDFWSGPMFDWERDDVRYRVATSVKLDAEDSLDLAMDLLKKKDGDEKWQIYREDEWQPGPPDFFFDFLNSTRDGWFDDEDDDLDFEPPENVDDLDLPDATISVLQRNGIWTVEELCEKTRAELLSIKGIGKKSLKTIVEELDYYGLELKEE